MKRGDDIERQLDIAAEQEPLEDLRSRSLEIERRVLGERAQVLADQELQAELDAARETEEIARPGESMVDELGLISIWSTPR